MKTLLTGGCGFIGCNTACRLKALGYQVTLFDNLSRPGGGRNLEWLRSQGDFTFVRGDVRDSALVNQVVREGQFEIVIHLAGQVAVTTSVQSPRLDFEVNALGTLNVLEAVRLHSRETVVLNASTNKVYGKLQNLAVHELDTRYELPELPYGVSEAQPLDFYSPYGCSKGSGDQYVTDYARIYGLRTVNFRQSCIYGYRQFGLEDQGWVAWFIIAHLLGRPITVYGSGKQVRDVLFIDDLVDCYLLAIKRIGEVAGQTFNIGGGPANILSLIEFLSLLEEFSGRPVIYNFADWRPGDQPVYVSDVRLARKSLGWEPRITVNSGIYRLYDWVAANLSLFSS